MSRSPAGAVVMNIPVRAIGQAMAAGVALLCSAYLATLVLRFGLDFDNAFGLVQVFGVQESSVITWYSSVLLLMCSVLLAVLALRSRDTGDRWAARWAGMAAVFAFLSLDEVASIHEKANIVGDRIGGSGIFHYAWVLVVAPLVLLFAVWQLGLLWSLPARLRWTMVVAGAMFVGGAIGVEMVSGWHVDRGRADDLPHALMGGLEETLEMAGAALFAHALLTRVAAVVPGVSLRATHDTGAGPRLGGGRQAAARVRDQPASARPANGRAVGERVPSRSAAARFNSLRRPPRTSPPSAR